MKNIHYSGRRKMDFLGGFSLIVILALILTIGVQANAQAATDPDDGGVNAKGGSGCGISTVAINGRGGYSVLDEAPKRKTGTKPCKRMPTSAMWMLGLWAASTR